MVYEMRTMVTLALTLFGLVSVTLASIDDSEHCGGIICEEGYSCVRRQVYCIRAPCPSHASCVRNRDHSEKEGSCPRRRPDFVGVCAVYCNGDDSCPGNQKCCGSCPTVCETPELLWPTFVKPGSCPNSPSLTFEPCEARCQSDAECPGNDKCCGSCIKECKSPVRTKVGVCPPRLLGGFRGAWCRSPPSELCTGDYDCDGNEKCCDNGCHSLCTRPQYIDDAAY